LIELGSLVVVKLSGCLLDCSEESEKFIDGHALVVALACTPIAVGPLCSWIVVR
jgi:hypothetical protein